MNSHSVKSERVVQFMARVNTLGKGEKTALKRSLGQTLSQADGTAVAAFYRALPSSVSQWEEEAFFLTATCICFWKDDNLPQRSFVDCLSIIGRDIGSMDKRVIALLDTEWNEHDSYFVGKIGRLMRMVKQKGLKPDFFELLNQLLAWTSPQRTVQRKWARVYFGNKGTL
jgi:CRISPR type I-E-associated protein CasB/Cse2